MPFIAMAVVVLASAAAALATACGPSSDPVGPQERTVFAQRWYTDTGPATTGDEENVGIVELENISKHTVYIRSARFQSVSPAVLTDYVVAYSKGMVRMKSALATTSKSRARRYYKPYLVTKDAGPPSC
jgi:hypothetical protein